MITISPLYEHPQHIRMVAEWIYNEFWTDKNVMTPDILEGLLTDAKTSTAIPMSWLAFVDNTPAGTVNLIENDNPNRPDLAPWLAALLVLPEFRERGIGSLLVKECEHGARQLGHERLFLGTDIPAYYERLGWRIFDSDLPRYCIMTIDLV